MLAQIKEVGLKRVALLYQDDSAGKALLSDVKSAAAAASVTIDVEVEIDLKQQNFDQAAELLRAGSPQAVIMCAAGTTFPKFVKAVLAKGDRPVFYGFSVAGLDVINQELGRDEITVRDQFLLDVNADGQLDTGPDRNVYLGSRREAVGLNDGAFSPAQFRGAGPALIRVTHRSNDKDPSIKYAEVSRVVPLR